MEEHNEEVKLYIYDLSAGLAPRLSREIFNRHIEAIWHTSIVVFGREYYFGQQGVVDCEPGSTNLGQPKEIQSLGVTHITEDLVGEYLQGLKQSTFRIGTYNLLRHNCNNFTNELSNFLVGKNIPEHIRDLPNTVINTLLGAEFAPLVNLLSDFVTSCRAHSPDYDQLNNDIEAARLDYQKPDHPGGPSGRTATPLQIKPGRGSDILNSLALEQRRNKITEKLERQEKKKNKKGGGKKKKNKSDKEISLDFIGYPPSDTNGIDDYSSTSNNNSKSRKKTYKMADNSNGDVHHNGNGNSSTDLALDVEQQERQEKLEKKKLREPPIIFKDFVNVQDEFDKVIGLVVDQLSRDDMQYFEELHQYMLEDEGSWALSDGFLGFLGKLLQNKNFPMELRVHLLNLLAAAALKEDIILVLHQDRREHVFMNYAYQFDKLPIEEQKPLALFMCNLFENPSSSEWLMYISEWEVTANNNISNIRVTTKIAVNALLADSIELQNYGTAIIYNLACKEKMHRSKSLRSMLPTGSISKVFDDVAVELTMALLQYFNNAKDEEHIFRCMKALAKFVQISPQEVVQLIQMIGPQPSKFRGTSERIDSFIAIINEKSSSR